VVKGDLVLANLTSSTNIISDLKINYSFIRYQESEMNTTKIYQKIDDLANDVAFDTLYDVWFIGSVNGNEEVSLDVVKAKLP
jgi:hypothetical protein